MKHRAAILLLGTVFAAPLAAQNKASDVTEAQIKKYKAGNEASCRDAGKAVGDAPEKVSAFCKCVTGVFEKSMSREDWQRAYFYSSKGQQAEERNVYGPHESKIRACRPG